MASREGAKVRSRIVLTSHEAVTRLLGDQTDVGDVGHRRLLAPTSWLEPNEATYIRGRLRRRRFRRTALSSTPVFSSLDGKAGIDRNRVDKESTHLRGLLINGA